MKNEKDSAIIESSDDEMVIDKKEKSKKRKKRFLKFLLIFFIIVAVFVAVTTVITLVGVQSNLNRAKSYDSANSAQLDLDNTSSGVWSVKSDNGLKVMQLTDVHIGGGWMCIRKDSMAINAVASMILAEKPDLVIVTGDLSYPVPFQAGTFNNKAGAKIFANLMETLGVYWTMGYGNHDTEAYSYYSREQLTKFYDSGEFPHCLLQPGPTDVDGEGNQVIKVVNSDGIITRSFIILDSHSYIDGDYFGIAWKYDNIHENQIQWYKDTVTSLTSENDKAILAMGNSGDASKYKKGQKVSTSVFFHIPMSEYRVAWNEYVQNDYKDTADVKYNYGISGETGQVVYSGLHEDKMFETMEQMCSTDSVFCGHDHYNSFSVNYKGINLTYGYSIDYLAYAGISKVGSQRGCTILDVAPNGSLNFHQENYYQDKYQTKYAKEKVTMQEFPTIHDATTEAKK